MDDETIHAAKQYVDVKERHAQFERECKDIENKFKLEIDTAKSVMTVFTTVTPAARLPDGRYVRVVTTETLRKVTEPRLRGAFASLTAEHVNAQTSLFDAVLVQLRAQCVSVNETVKITTDTKGLPPAAFPIPQADEELQRACTSLEQAERGLKTVRKHKRKAKKEASDVIGGFAKKVESAVIDDMERTPCKRARSESIGLLDEEDVASLPTTTARQTRERVSFSDDDCESTQEEQMYHSQSREEDVSLCAESVDDNESDMGGDDERGDDDSENGSDGEQKPRPKTYIISQPPNVTLPGEATPTYLPPKTTTAPVVASENDTPTVIESCIVGEEDIRIKMVESVHKGRNPTVKVFSTALKKVLRGVTTYAQFNKHRGELTERAVELFNGIRSETATTTSRLKIDAIARK